MRVSIDTCIILDLLLNKNDKSIEKLKKHCHDHDEMIVCGMVYGELVPFFIENGIDADLFFSEMDIKIENCTPGHYAYAGKKWGEHNRRRRIICPDCGKSLNLKCPYCESPVRFRRHILADFIVGAFSEMNCDGLLTRDFGYYKTYFPKLRRL